MFASIKNLFFGNNNPDPFDMEQRTRALLAQTHRNRIAGKQSQQRAHRPMQTTAMKTSAPRTMPQNGQATTQKRPIANQSKASLTNLKADLF